VEKIVRAVAGVQRDGSKTLAAFLRFGNEQPWTEIESFSPALRPPIAPSSGNRSQILHNQTHSMQRRDGIPFIVPCVIQIRSRSLSVSSVRAMPPAARRFRGISSGATSVLRYP
jgi:hypothetical protein